MVGGGTEIIIVLVPVSRGAAGEFGEELGTEAVEFGTKQGGDAIDDGLLAGQGEDARFDLADALHFVQQAGDWCVVGAEFERKMWDGCTSKKTPATTEKKRRSRE